MSIVPVLVYERSEMKQLKKKRKEMPIYSPNDFFSGKKDAKPVGWMSDPDECGSVLVDRVTLERLGVNRKKG